MYNIVLECVCVCVWREGVRRLWREIKNVVKNICNDIGQNIVVKLSGSDSLIFCRELNFS